MRRDDPIEEIRRRWRLTGRLLEWRRLSPEARADVIGELDEASLHASGEDRTARLVAADALAAMQDPTILRGLEAIAEDVGRLLQEIDQLRSG